VPLSISNKTIILGASTALTLLLLGGIIARRAFGLSSPLLPPPPAVLAYVYASAGPGAVGSFTSQTRGAFASISPDCYDMNYQTGLYINGQEGVLEVSADGISLTNVNQVEQSIVSNGAKCWPLIYAGQSNNGTDQGIIDVVNDMNKRNAFFQACLDRISTQNVQGFIFDCEASSSLGGPGSPITPQQFYSFINAWADFCHSNGVMLGMNTVSFNEIGQGGNLYTLKDLSSTRIDLLLPEDYSNTFSGFQSQINHGLQNIPITKFCPTLINQQNGTNPFASQAVNYLESKNVQYFGLWDASENNGVDWVALARDFTKSIQTSLSLSVL
jgi:hypothetical protein